LEDLYKDLDDMSFGSPELDVMGPCGGNEEVDSTLELQPLLLVKKENKGF